MGDKLAVGIDFGGTKILAGVVNLETGALVGTSKKKTRAAHEQDDLIKRIISVVDDALSEPIRNGIILREDCVQPRETDVEEINAASSTSIPLCNNEASIESFKSERTLDIRPSLIIALEHTIGAVLPVPHWKELEP